MFTTSCGLKDWYWGHTGKFIS